MKILVVRNDKLGDFVLALPAFAMLKKSLPNASIVALVPKYTASIAEFVPYIDEVLPDNGNTWRLIHKIKNFDAVVVLFSSKKIALASFLARIPTRIAPATKIWQFFFNHRLTQRRSRSIKPEFQYNLDLVRYFLNLNQTKIIEPTTPYLDFEVTTKSKKIVIHPGSGGSANNLSLAQYAKLADNLFNKNPNIVIIISAGPGETDIANDLRSKMSSPCEIFFSTKGLIEYGKFLANCCLFISGSTGTLHLSGAININTVGFYPNRRSTTSLRWQTLNDASKRLAFSPPKDSQLMQDMDLVAVVDEIWQKFLNGY